MQRYAVFFIIPVIFILDRWTKLIIVRSFTHLESIQITSFFSIVNGRNYGGVFGFLSEYLFAKYIFTFFPLLIIGVLIYILLRYTLPFSKKIALTCLLSGAIGNIYDRLSYGYVIDFLDIYYKNYHWPAFNVADISITTGICLWFYVELFQYKKEKSARNG